MRIIRIIGRSIKDAFHSVFRNFSLSIASISCAAITLLIVGIAVLFTFNVKAITQHIEDVLTIIVFIDKDASDSDIETLGEQIKSIDNVNTNNVEFNSKDDIKNEISQDESMKNVLDTLDENPLKSTYVVKVNDVKKIDETANTIKGFEHVSEVKYGESLVSKLVSMFDVIRTVSYAVVVALIFVTFFLIGNTIKLTIYSRRQEVSIMRLVGTSNTVIKLPFVIEGLILGVIGSIIPILITIFGYQFFYDYVGGTLFSSLVVLVNPNEVVYTTSLVLLCVGAIVGVFGSLNAVRRYLKI